MSSGWRAIGSWESLAQIAKDFGIHEMTLNKWLRKADIEDGAKPGITSSESRRAARVAAPESAVGAGERGAAPGLGVSVAGEPAGKMMFPLVRDLAGVGVPVTATCRVLKLCRAQYYRWPAAPVTDAKLEDASWANALFDAHTDDPEFGYRFLQEEVTQVGVAMSARTAWRICRDNSWWRVFGRKKAPHARSRAHRSTATWCSATSPLPERTSLWLTDITEHRTDEGKLHLCAVKDVYSNRIVGYSMDSRMKARLAVNALNNAVARRGDVAGCIVHSDRGSQFRARKCPPRSKMRQLAWANVENDTASVRRK